MKKLSLILLLFSFLALPIKPVGQQVGNSAASLAMIDEGGQVLEQNTAALIAGLLGVWCAVKAAKHFFKKRNRPGGDLSELGNQQVLGTAAQYRPNAPRRMTVLNRNLLPTMVWGSLAGLSFLVSFSIFSS